MKVKELINKIHWGSHPTITIKSDINTELFTMGIRSNQAETNRLFSEMEDKFGGKTVNAIEILGHTIVILVK